MTDLWTNLVHPLSYGFFQRGLIVATLAGALLGFIGVYITLRGMSYIGHGLSHAIFGGYAAAPLLGIPIVLGAGLWGLASALAINAVTRRHRIGADAAIGVVTTAAGYVLFYAGLRVVPGSVAALLTLVEPLTAAALAVLLLGERLTVGLVGGGALMLAAVALLYLSPQHRSA